ncbi:MAG: RecQ family ATP-dependent DNA helicase [Gemmobacter sp.]
MAARSFTLPDRCLSLDLEVDPKTARIFALAAVRNGVPDKVVSRKGQIDEALTRFEAMAGRADYLLGHNIIGFDLPHLLAVRPGLARLAQKPIDTLWLNPLASPRNPYHRLVKHHHDGRLQAGHVNDPERDARLVLDLFAEQLQLLSGMAAGMPEALTAWHFLCTRMPDADGFDAVFAEVRGADCPDPAAAEAAVRAVLAGRACTLRVDQTLTHLHSPPSGWPMAYALAWITVAGGDSVMPPWVRARFREAAQIVKTLRDAACDRPDCAWCRTQNDPKAALSRWFGFDGFRPEPADVHGVPLQERIVAEAMAGHSLLGILPTGTGKSVCYQVPALTQYDKTGALTVVISPLVALMADQVRGLARHGISACVTVNGMLSMPERQDALDRVRLGDAAILLIAPEQLRSRSVRSVLRQRDVGYWVLDEAHCVSKWGHDFRPDYRYIARFVRAFSGDMAPAPVLCLTATAKPEVIRDILDHFRSKLQVDLALLDGGAVRDNLTFEVRETRASTKLGDIMDVIDRALPPEGASGAIVYCATRDGTQRVAAFLRAQGLAADFFHAKLLPERKREVQESFQNGDLRIIAATNAFGMGIDKPDIRLVVHGDIPGSLESYLQEAGRAGRDRDRAVCVLLYCKDDVERQFDMSARSRLARHEIGAILKALRRMDRQKSGEVVATSGEIVREERDLEFERDSATDDTRVKTAVSWLEEAALLSREENSVQVFPSSLQVRTLAEAEARLAGRAITDARRRQLLAIVRHLMNAPPDQGISTDELTGVSGLAGYRLQGALTDLETLGIATNDTAITVFVHVGVEQSSAQRFSAAADLEKALIDEKRERAPDAGSTEPLPLLLAETCQVLRDRGHEGVRPDLVETLLRGMAQDGREEEGGGGNLQVRKARRGTMMVRLEKSWDLVVKTAEVRRLAAERLLRHLTGLVAKGTRGKDLQVETTVGRLMSELSGDALLRDAVKDLSKLQHRAMMWLHEQDVVKLGRGLTVFRQAITVHLRAGGGPFTQRDFLPLEEHYGAQTVQTHIMARYAERGLTSQEQAEQLTRDYFALDTERFLQTWMPDSAPDLRRQTLPSSWRMIVEDLANPVQQKIVADDREATNVLVLAGPGSGKTRVLVHRIAYLVRVRRADPRGILVLTYNRHAAAEIRLRLSDLIGDAAAWVTVSTCHALAMRLVGASFAGAFAAGRTVDFDQVLREAVTLLRGDGLTRAEAEARREALIEGYRWILVDEYQDIGADEYALIAAVAGRSLDDADKLSLFAVGDDDQNIYAFAGASVDYIRRFEADYAARPAFLTENYRSTQAIIAAANRAIAPAKGRMKADHDITIDRLRRKAPEGGAMVVHDPVAAGRVQVLRTAGGEVAQAVAAVDELVRLSRLAPGWDWSRAAVIAREWSLLHPVRSYAEAQGIPVQMARDRLPPLWRLREFQALLHFLRGAPGGVLAVPQVLDWIGAQWPNRWWHWLCEGIEALASGTEARPVLVAEMIEALTEWSLGARAAQRGLLLLTAHRAKGLEFDDVVVLDGGWDRSSPNEDADAPRRLFYVAMTRARRSLAMTSMAGRHPILTGDGLLHRTATPDPAALQQADLWYQAAEMGMVDLSFPGRLEDRAEALALLAGLRIGDPLVLDGWQGRWLIRHVSGVTIGRMAAVWQPPPGRVCVRAEVFAVVRWRKVDNAEDFQPSLKRDAWDVVLPEFVFGPEVG